LITAQERSGQLISGVPSLEWCRLKDTTFVGALEAATSVTDHAFDYQTLMGLTGLAFRVRWHQDTTGARWLPFSAMGDGPEVIAAVRQTTGWQLRVAHEADVPGGVSERFLPEIVASLDAGLPVLGYRRFEKLWDTGVIYGYEGGGATLLATDYFAGPDGPLRLRGSDLHPFFIFLEQHRTLVSPYDALIFALGLAARDWRRGYLSANETWHWRRYAPGTYHLYGDTALAAWLADLEAADTLSAGDRERLFGVSWFHYDILYGARCSAAAFLTENAALLKGKARAAIAQAAALYQQECALLDSAWERQDAFLGPWTSKHSIAEWTPAIQRRERAILAEARQLEAAAIGQIERALSAVGVDH
jgi:hypothetical protein